MIGGIARVRISSSSTTSGPVDARPVIVTTNTVTRLDTDAGNGAWAEVSALRPIYLTDGHWNGHGWFYFGLSADLHVFAIDGFDNVNEPPPVGADDLEFGAEDSYIVTGEGACWLLWGIEEFEAIPTNGIWEGSSERRFVLKLANGSRNAVGTQGDNRIDNRDFDVFSRQYPGLDDQCTAVFTASAMSWIGRLQQLEQVLEGAERGIRRAEQSAPLER